MRKASKTTPVLLYEFLFMVPFYATREPFWVPLRSALFQWRGRTLVWRDVISCFECSVRLWEVSEYNLAVYYWTWRYIMLLSWTSHLLPVIVTNYVHHDHCSRGRNNLEITLLLKMRCNISFLMFIRKKRDFRVTVLHQVIDTGWLHRHRKVDWYHLFKGRNRWYQSTFRCLWVAIRSSRRFLKASELAVANPGFLGDSTGPRGRERGNHVLTCWCLKKSRKRLPRKGVCIISWVLFHAAPPSPNLDSGSASNSQLSSYFQMK